MLFLLIANISFSSDEIPIFSERIRPRPVTEISNFLSVQVYRLNDIVSLATYHLDEEKLVTDGRTDGKIQGETFARTDGHTLLKRFANASKSTCVRSPQGLSCSICVEVTYV